MQDRLEDFIKENRGQFDDVEPRHSVWEKIDVELSDEKVKSIAPRMWYWKAAVVILVAAVSLLLVDRYTFREQEIVAVTTVDEFNELETFYTALISKKELKVDDATSSDKFFTFLETDIEEIDAIYLELKKTFNEDQETPAVLDALVHLLRQKLHLLSSQLEVIDNLKVRESGITVDDEDISSL